MLVSGRVFPILNMGELPFSRVLAVSVGEFF